MKFQNVNFLNLHPILIQFPKFHIFGRHLTLEIAKKNRQWVQPISVSNALLCPAIYGVDPNTVSLAFNIHLLNFPLSTCCGRIVLYSA